MMYRIFPVVLVGLALAACSHDPGEQYWQRSSVSESIYLQGPKAQQMLTRDIGRCVTDLREQENLGMIRDAIPTDPDGRVLDPDELAVLRRNTPDRDGHLFSEYYDYSDFESCMDEKGWVRVKHVPYERAEKARTNYFKATGRWMEHVMDRDDDGTSASDNDYRVNR